MRQIKMRQIKMRQNYMSPKLSVVRYVRVSTYTFCMFDNWYIIISFGWLYILQNIHFTKNEDAEMFSRENFWQENICLQKFSLTKNFVCKKSSAKFIVEVPDEIFRS